jgi:5-methylcytosine-specific restriction endonuclease McrA
MKSLKNLSNNDLLNRLRRLVEKEQKTTLEILPHLVEVERRKLYLEKAYSTLSEYCICELGYGESAAWRRVRAARVILEVPEVYDLMKEGRLTFSAVVQISPVLNAKNKKALLPRVEGKSKNEIERVLAEFRPPQVIPDQARPRVVKRQVSVERAPADADASDTGGRESAPELGEISLRSEGKNNPTVKNSTPEIEVVLEKMYEIRFAADEELMELIRWMKSHLSHKFPKGASFLEIFKYVMKYYKDREDLATNKPSRSVKTKPRTDTRHIPKAIQREVWQKDNGSCAFIGPNGRRCNSQHNLQFDHYPIPFARGGPSTVDNLRLLCAKHNRYTAEQLYGEQCIRKHFNTIKESREAYYS